MMNDTQITRLFWAAKAGLIALLLYIGAGAVMAPFRLDTALRPNAVSGDEQRHSPVVFRTANEGPVDYSAIVKNDLFAPDGPVNPDVSEAADAMRSAEELGLRLVGAVAFPGSPAASRAVIESDQTKSTRPYKIGDVVASATVESIASDRVVLLYAGERRVLVLRTATATEGPAGTNASSTEHTAFDSEPIGQTSSRLSYVEEIFRKATIEPHVQDGQTDGLKISGLDQTPLATAFGLRNGDIVRAVNGQDLTSKQKAFQVLKKARTQSKLDIELLRDGKTRNLSFDL
jgi:general secretion pathway protein C